MEKIETENSGASDMKQQIDMTTKNFSAVHTSIEGTELNGIPVLRVVKKDKISRFDENTYAKVDGLLFHNGTIEVKVLSRILQDAPDFARGFIGIVFRANESDSEFESFYVRPANGRGCTDPVRKSQGCQYFSYPGYTFEYFREYHITDYEAPVDAALDEWITIKAVIEDERAEFYLNGNEQPVLVVNDMKHGRGRHGSVGIFVDIGTEAFISELKVVCMD